MYKIIVILFLSFTVNLKSQTIYNDCDCSHIETNKDEFTGIKHINSPGLEPISFEKEITETGDIDYIMYLTAPSPSPNIGEGITIIFTDGTKYFKNAKVDSRVSIKGDMDYEETAMIILSNAEIEKFKTKTIKAFRLYVSDVHLESDNSEQYREYLCCLLKSK